MSRGSGQQVSKRSIETALIDVGIQKSDVLYLQTDLMTPGSIKSAGSKAEFCETYLAALLEAVGDSGTLVCPTFSTQIGRHGQNFIWEETPTMLGLFPEFLRKHNDSLRSLHPLHSVSALGAQKTKVCTNNGQTDFGWGSPYHRLLEMDAKIVAIGLEKSFAVAIANLIEAFSCVPYNYNKLLKWKTVVNGVALDKSFISVARHLQLKTEHNLRQFAKAADEQGLIRSTPLGRSAVRLTSFREVFDFGVNFLTMHPYGLLERPPKFKYGILPFDGPTLHLDGVDHFI